MAQKRVHIRKILVFMTLLVVIKAQFTSNTSKQNGRYSRTTTGSDISTQKSKGRFSTILYTVKNTNHNPFNEKIDRKINTTLMPVKKWQVGRVSRKQYEIINMLWRKTNIFLDDVENISLPCHKPKNNRPKDIIGRQKFTISPMNMELPSKVSYSSTPSYIEFYYLDETEDVKHKDPMTPKVERKLLGNRKLAGCSPFRKIKSFSRSPFFAFHVNDPGSALRRTTRTFHSTAKLISTIAREKMHLHDIMLHVLSDMKLVTNMTDKLSTPVTSQSHTYNLSLETKVIKAYVNDNNTIDNTKQAIIMQITPSLESLNNQSENSNNSDTMYLKSTTNYDKIKFFELYDSYTDKPLSGKGKDVFVGDDTENVTEENDVNIDHKILLEHIDEAIKQHHSQRKIKNAKKHIKSFDNERNRFPKQFVPNNAIKGIVSNVTTDHNFNSMDTETNLYCVSPHVSKLVHDNVLNSDLTANMSRYVAWSEYPFVAVYVYERYQVHCDAAVISPHWLVAAGSCLSRHSDDHAAEGRSAFVAYCGENWWSPERIAYVKYSVVHPKYHPRDRTRRQFYNIGAIQVASSMDSACSNWEPISIMSHQFAADSEGAIATTVGWGLDRYTSTTLPRISLTAYEGLVFSDSCPGNSGYRKAKYQNDESLKNVYCLSLPPYIGEQSDPVHGSLLLVGGKLIALYLQEERRQWGDQSAQYTGVWRLAPWLYDVAREPEEADFLL